jgi:hypothetical protein
LAKRLATPLYEESRLDSRPTRYSLPLRGSMIPMPSTRGATTEISLAFEVGECRAQIKSLSITLIIPSLPQLGEYSIYTCSRASLSLGVVSPYYRLRRRTRSQGSAVSIAHETKTSFSPLAHGSFGYPSLCQEKKQTSVSKSHNDSEQSHELLDNSFNSRES